MSVPRFQKQQSHCPNSFLQDWHKGKQNNSLAQISNKIRFLFTQIPKLPLIWTNRCSWLQKSKGYNDSYMHKDLPQSLYNQLQ